MIIKLRELFLMASTTLVLYYLYWCIADEDFFERVFVEHSYSLLRVAIDGVVCLVLTWLSILYSEATMQLMNTHKNLQRTLWLHTMLLFVLDILTALGVSELVSEICKRLFHESSLQSFLVYFSNIFVFALLATLISTIKTNSMFWQKRIEMEREHAFMENKVAEAERVKAKARLHNLQSQVNPHFFFNNLSTLSSLISTDPTAAKEFVNALALMYRHILTGMRHDIVPLKEELQLVGEYAKLLRIRHGGNVRIAIPDADRLPENAFVPPASIQHLVENAVKHNAMTASAPLHINIECRKGRVCVTNNRNPLSSMEEQTGTGLSNLKEQLGLLGLKGMERTEEEKVFSVSFPLIIQKQPS